MTEATDAGILRRDWLDIEFTAVIEVDSHHADFKVYEIVGVGEHGELRFHRSGSGNYPDPVSSIAESEPYLHGAVKWDGCSNWHFDEQDCLMLHGCCREDLLALGEVMARCWDWAAELLPTWNAG